MERFPTKFNNFDENKCSVNSLTQRTTTKVRTQIAGYITHKISLVQANSPNKLVVEKASE